MARVLPMYEGREAHCPSFAPRSYPPSTPLAETPRPLHPPGGRGIVSAGRRTGLSGLVGAISARGLVGRASETSSSRIANEIRQRIGLVDDGLSRSGPPNHPL